MHVRFGLMAVPGLMLALGCSSSGPDERFITYSVEHHRRECQGMVLQLCPLVRSPGEETFLNFYDGIEGFSPEWGRVYEIEVQEFAIANPPQDGSSARTVLHRVISEEQVDPDTEFTLVLSSGGATVAEVAPGRYGIYDQAEFSCTDGTSCAELDAAIEAGDRIEYRFRYASFAPLEFELLEWNSCAPGFPGSPCL